MAQGLQPLLLSCHSRREGVHSPIMAERKKAEEKGAPAGRSAALIDTRVIYCGDCLGQLQEQPDGAWT